MVNEQHKELVYLETDKLALTIKGTASHPQLPGVSFDQKESLIKIACSDEFSLSVNGQGDFIPEAYLENGCLGQYLICPIFFEQQSYEIIIEPNKDINVEFWHENLNIRKNVTPVGRNSNILSGIINFGNEIGMSDLVVRVDNKEYLKIIIEVFPSKISYKDDYMAIVDDVTSEVYNLAFDFLKRTYESFDISSKTNSSQVEFFAIIKKIYKDFLTAADMVIARPHHILAKEYEVLPAHKAKRVDSKSVRWIEKHPEQAMRDGNRIKVANTLAVKKYVTYDTKENRLTKYILQNTAKRLENLKKLYANLKRETDQAFIDQVDSMIKGIERRYRTGFLKEVQSVPMNSGMSLVFSMAPGYRDLYKYYLMMQRGLSITGSIFNISMKNVAELYEYWCFIKLNSILRKKYELKSQDIIKTSGKELFVSLRKGKASNVVYVNSKSSGEKEKITLSYNPKKDDLPTVAQKPDNVLCLDKMGSKINYEYIFDAKYRINPTDDEDGPGPQEDDINTMHRYRDAIVCNHNASPHERTMFGAYVLFPYNDVVKYKDHKFYKSIKQVNVGGLPFLPSATRLVEEMLDELIADSSEAAFDRATLPYGMHERILMYNEVMKKLKELTMEQE